MALYEALLQAAEAHGFPLRGGVDIDSVAEFSRHVGRYDEWLGKGFEGEMEYLRRGRDRRADPRLVFPQAQSVFCVAVPYWRNAIGDGIQGPRYARYLKGGDYHSRVFEKLALVLADVRDAHPSLKWKICVDTSAVLERSWAALAGLGWIGKNTTLIHPRYGSYLFIAEALLSEPLARGPNPLPNYCGNCTRCLDACPTRAFSGPGSLDARRCISYWTLEKRGPLGISDEDRAEMGTWIAGCDVCQEVCPFNTKPAREAQPELQAGSGAGGGAITNGAAGGAPENDALALRDWLSLLREAPEQYRARVRNSALSRVKPAQFSRNLAITLANASPAEWTQEIRAEASRRARDETDEAARTEWARCVERMGFRTQGTVPGKKSVQCGIAAACLRPSTTTDE